MNEDEMAALLAQADQNKMLTRDIAAAIAAFYVTLTEKGVPSAFAYALTTTWMTNTFFSPSESS